MSLDDRFDDMVASLGGFYRTWYAYTGLELGFFAQLREAGATGLSPVELGTRTGADPALVSRWAWGADAHDLVLVEDGRITLADDVAHILLDAARPEYLGGLVQFAAVASLDYAALPGVFRTGSPLPERPDRYRAAIERLTLQDIGVFFQEVLAALPQLVVDLAPGSRILDVHCGGGRWLVAMARRFPGTQLTGIEFEPDSVARARANVGTAGLTDRILIEHGDVAAIHHDGEAQLAYFQYALHLLPDAVGALRSAWDAVRPGGWLVTLDWYLPSDPEDQRTRLAELLAGTQLDELVSGTGLVTRSEALGWFAAAGIPVPDLIDLPSGAGAIVARKA
jgi:SAM-dependent methyltransferase